MKESTKRKFATILGMVWEYLIVSIPVGYFFFYLQRKFPFNIPETEANILFFAIFFGLGIFWTARYVLDLSRKGEGTIIPFYHPPVKLVTSGVYGYCRNPHYLGYIFLFMGISFLIRSLTLLLFSIFGMLLFLRIYATFVEEKALTKRFGESYLKYKNETPLLLPLRMKKSWGKGIRLAHLIFFLTLICLICLQILYITPLNK
jgi:protein-S-isoprenylcysteine O-methyltransferase Ste14